MKKLFEEQPESEQLIFEKVKKNRFAKYKKDLSLQDNMKNPLFAATFQNTLRKEYPKIFDALTSNYKPKIEALKKAINDL